MFFYFNQVTGEAGRTPIASLLGGQVEYQVGPSSTLSQKLQDSNRPEHRSSLQDLGSPHAGLEWLLQAHAVMKVCIDDHHHSNRPQGERTELGLTARWTSSVTDKQ